MDELYSNLENYNEVNIVEELKNENEELKHKLEECSNAMNLLQTDFDKLNSEYKKLELNYSSLLKTARAEIERKTQLITNLNKEKDMLVISSMQRGRKNILNNLTHKMNRVFNSNKKDTDKKEVEKEFPNGNKNKLTPIMEMKEDLRVEPRSTSPMGSVSSVCTTNKSTSSENNLRNTSDKHCSDSKENILKNVLEQQHKDSKAQSKKIINRRKSMPIPILSDVSSEDEQIKDRFTNKRAFKRQKEYESKTNSDLNYRNSHKTSDHSKYESKNKYTNERHTDKYNPHLDHRTRPHHRTYHRSSPERDRHKSHTENDHSYKSDYRQRKSKSPSLDKYKRSKSRDRRHRERDYQWDHDNYNLKHNRNDYKSEERAYIKEPDHKRRKLESTSTETERTNRFIDRKGFKLSECNSNLNHDDFTSCQSPDYEQIESNIHQHFVKEIKNTASVQLEDPRITSKKYVLKKSDNGSFITAIGKNVCMKPIDTSQWVIEKVEVPQALQEEPFAATLSDDIINNIYMDIDDPAEHLSTQENRKSHSTDSDSHISIASDIPELHKHNHKEDINLTNSYHDQNSHINIHDQTSKPSSSHYKIPKKSKADTKDDIVLEQQANKKETYTEDSDKDVKNLEKSSSINSVQCLDTYVSECTSNGKLKNQVQRVAPVKDTVEGDLELSDEASDITDDIQAINKYDYKFKVNVSVPDTQSKVEEYQEIDNYNNRTAKTNKHQEEKINKTYELVCDENISKRREEECSNETFKEICEEKNLDLEKVEEFQNIISNVEHKDKSPKESKRCNKKIDKEEFKEEIPKKFEEFKIKISKKKCEEKTTENFNECKVPKSHSKDTKKREKRKKVSKGGSGKTQRSEVQMESLGNVAEKQFKDSKPKNKFTELFGESSSLITPDDLGISAKFEINTERNDKYGSLFENTQDAIDLNVREIQEKHNTEINNSDTLVPSKVLSTEDNSQISYAIDNKSTFEMEDKKSADNIFKNLKAATNECESNIIKTVVISSGMQPIVEEKEIQQEKLPESKSTTVGESVSSKLQPLELLTAVATSTPHKMQYGTSSTLMETDTLNGESISKDDFSMSNTGYSTTTNVEVPENNAPDVRIFLKRRRKIKKTS